MSDPSGTVLVVPVLSDRDRALLDFARRTYRHRGTQEDAMRRELGLSPTAYYQQLNALVDRPEARAYAPTVAKRIRRLAGRE